MLSILGISMVHEKFLQRKKEIGMACKQKLCPCSSLRILWTDEKLELQVCEKDG
jgi:hypothetical protein